MTGWRERLTAAKPRWPWRITSAGGFKRDPGSRCNDLAWVFPDRPSGLWRAWYDHPDGRSWEVGSGFLTPQEAMDAVDRAHPARVLH